MRLAGGGHMVDIWAFGLEVRDFEISHGQSTFPFGSLPFVVTFFLKTVYNVALLINKVEIKR